MGEIMIGQNMLDPKGKTVSILGFMTSPSGETLVSCLYAKKTKPVFFNLKELQPYEYRHPALEKDSF